MKASKTALTATGSEATGDRILLGTPGQRFRFATDAPCVTLVGCSVKANLAPVVAFVKAAGAPV
jgi:hypothetical protein